MRRSSGRGALALAATLFLASCGSSTSTPSKDGGTKGDVAAAKADGAAAKKVEDYVPAPGAAWEEDTAAGKAGVEAAYTDVDIEKIIDGENAPYAAEGTVGFAKQDYKKDGHKLLLKLWQMKTAAGAKKMFDANKKDAETNAGLIFEPVAQVADTAVIAYDQPQWKVFGHKGPFIYEVFASLGNVAQKDALKTSVLEFVQALAKALP
ncbi:MAG: hypothetical protein IT371_06480 [Deltaproteobacteria bacterium]|nr:hypothetical protein [Deltaproteobacteria bacterium]